MATKVGEFGSDMATMRPVYSIVCESTQDIRVTDTKYGDLVISFIPVIVSLDHATSSSFIRNTNSIASVDNLFGGQEYWFEKN